MGIEFWLHGWQEGRIPFHRRQVQKDLIHFWPLLEQHQPQNVLVPLCGKSLDMQWLVEQGMKVTGIDLSTIAIESFIQEHQLKIKHHKTRDVDLFQNSDYNFLVADIFKMDASLIPPQDAMYDKAALIALPEKLRPAYVQCCLQWLKPGAVLLLKTIHYDQTLMEGPPYAVSPDEVYRLFQNCQSIQPLLTRHRYLPENDNLFQRGLHYYKDQVWLIKI